MKSLSKVILNLDVSAGMKDLHMLSAPDKMSVKIASPQFAAADVGTRNDMGMYL